jgi:hypothetical protein
MSRAQKIAAVKVVGAVIVIVTVQVAAKIAIDAILKDTMNA